MAIDLRTVAGATNSDKLSNAAIAGGEYYLTGAPFALSTGATINNRAFSLTGDADITGSVTIELQNFSQIDGVDFAGPLLNIPSTANVSNSVLLNLGIKSGSWIRTQVANRVTIPNTQGLLINNLLFDGSRGIDGWFEGATIQNCTAQNMPSPNSLLFSGGGVNNTIQDNTVYGNVLYSEGGIQFYTMRSDLDLPWKNVTGNIVRRNNIYNVREEGIGFDCVDPGPFSGPVSAISGSQFTVTPQVNYGSVLTPPTYVGFTLTFLSGALMGRSFLITGSSGNTFTIDGYPGGAQVGDWATPHIQFANNEITDNEFSWDVINIDDPTNSVLPTALVLWGSASNNLVARNHVTRGIYPVEIAYVVHAKGGLYFPSHYNTIEDNVVDLMTSCWHVGARNYVNLATVPVPPWSVGNVIRRNTVTQATGYSTPVVRDYQSLTDIQFDYLKDWSIYNNSFSPWGTYHGNSPTITDPNMLAELAIAEATAASFVDGNLNITRSTNIRKTDGSSGGTIKKIDGTPGGVVKRYLSGVWQ